MGRIVLEFRDSYFYPRPPRGGRRQARSGHQVAQDISIHALREEGDPRPTIRTQAVANFYPRPPRGGRHAFSSLLCGSVVISIHALREEGDVKGLQQGTRLELFLSTPSARRATVGMAMFPPKLTLFLSTPSARRATAMVPLQPLKDWISIHALREEGDPLISRAGFVAWLFLSTPSARRATTCCRCGAASRIYFYPRPPRGGRRGLWLTLATPWAISIHALREEGDVLRIV